MYTSTFTFAKRDFDDEFHALDEAIAQAARATPGYLGEECWENPSQRARLDVYYWLTLPSLQALMAHPAHVAAKQRQQQWLAGYHVVIAEVVGSYGECAIAHPFAGTTLSMPGRPVPMP
jgi:heme-degrading monooxygenase HmoA